MALNDTSPEQQKLQVDAGIENETTERSLSHWQLLWRRFLKHRLAVFGLIVIIGLYMLAIFCEFFAPMDPYVRYSQFVNAPPQRIRFVDHEGNFSIRPFVYGHKSTLDMQSFRRVYEPDYSKRYDLRLFTKGSKYKLWGFFPGSLRFFGVEEGGHLFLFGTDNLGRDVFSRIIYGSRISLSIGLIGVFISLAIGMLLGGISGLRGGLIDELLQRVIELLRSVPDIPLWMGLSAALPPHWSPIRVYFGITVILSLLGWTHVARVVRSRFLSLRNEEFVLAAYAAGASEWRIITKHLIPSFISYVIVSVTLSIPGMILGETALSFLGIGLRPPVISWGVLLEQAQNIAAVNTYPWLLTPAIFVILTVLSLNFVGDGLRDAADPYSK